MAGRALAEERRGPGEEPAIRGKRPPGWLAGRFEAQSWPGDDAFVYVINSRTHLLVGWLIIAACFLAWFWFERRLAHWRFVLLAAVMIVSLLGGWLLPSRYATDTAGAFVAAFGLLVVELGRGFRRPGTSNRTRRRWYGPFVSRAASSLALVVLSLDSMAVGQAIGQANAILVLYPYDGPFDPNQPARDVVLRFADFTRLKQLAASESPEQGGLVRAVGAVHRVAPKSDVDVVVESQFELVATGRSPFAWEFPVSSARDIQVTLNGKRLPVSIAPGGVTAKVAIPEGGNHLLSIRRSVLMNREDGRESISLAVNAVPTARVVVQPREDGGQGGALIAGGKTELQPDHTVIGRLGPADRVEVYWGMPAGAPGNVAPENVEGLLLWDITPAGDQIRARFTFHGPRKRSTIRFAHQQGLILRSARASGSIDAVCEEDTTTGEWVVHVDPAFQSGSAIELDCWLPIEAERDNGGGKAWLANGQPGGLLHILPRLAPTGVRRYSGSLGVRRPGDWTGRFNPLPNTDPISDESFVEAWGTLPQEPLTLSGTSRFVRECRAALFTGPAPTRVQVKPTINVQIESGRIVMTVDADLTELSGHLRRVEVVVPENLQIIGVTSEGLTDWTISNDHRLALMFDRPITRPKRHLRVLAWIPILEEPLKITRHQHRVATPWFWWNGLEVSAGFLTISSTVKPELRGSTGLTLISSEPTETAETTSPSYRSTYRVDDCAKTGRDSLEFDAGTRQRGD